MTIKEAEEIERTLIQIRNLKKLNGKIQDLYAKKELNEVANIALELASELLNFHEKQLSEYPTKQKEN